jgi:threonine dehydratase
MIPASWFIQARSKSSPYLKVTPLTVHQEEGLLIKWENHQVTGSFKARGALNKVFHLQEWEQQAGLLAASAGNHGQGVALAGSLVSTTVTIYVPKLTPQVKIQAIKKLGAEVVLIPGGYSEAEKAAQDAASTSNAVWISPYNDGQVIAGQGTIALEILEQVESFDSLSGSDPVWVVPTSGGGLLAGIASALERFKPGSRVVGVQTDTSPFMHALFHGNSQEGIQERPTIAEGLAGPVEEGSITIPIIRQFVDDIILVSEEEIAQGLAYAWREYGERIEASAAVVFASVLCRKINHRPLILIVSGGNIQDALFDSIIGSKSLQ